MESFDAFYERHREPVLAYFARRVGEPEVAADLMAETFARALVRYRKVPPEAPEAWLFAIARNLLIDSARRGGRGLRATPAQARAARTRRPGPRPDRGDRGGRRPRGARARVLSDAEYEALHARAVDEEPYAELALRLRCSEAVVRKRVSRAIARVRSMTGDADGLP